MNNKDTAIQKRYDLFLKDFETIVNIDSSSDHKPGISQVADFFENRFKALGFTTKRLDLFPPHGHDGHVSPPDLTKDDNPVTPNNGAPVPCLQATYPADAKQFDIMMIGHMDTVFPKGEVAKRPFKIVGDRAMGPGVCDMKGGLLLALHLLETLKENGTLENLSICVAFNGDEETGSEASRQWLDETAKKCARVFVFEPCRPGYRFVLWRKGGGWFDVTTEGVSAHAGADPEKGANAVVELAHQIVDITTTLNDPKTGTSAQVTVIEGGDKVNIIPNQAKAKVDVRIATHGAKDRVENFFKQRPENIHVPGCSVHVKGHIDRPPMVPNDETLALWQILKNQGDKMGLTPDAIATGGCSDGNYPSAFGIPTIDGMGLVGANSHREDEYVELGSIVKMIQLLSRMCKRLAETA